MSGKGRWKNLIISNLAISVRIVSELFMKASYSSQLYSAYCTPRETSGIKLQTHQVQHARKYTAYLLQNTCHIRFADPAAATASTLFSLFFFLRRRACCSHVPAGGLLAKLSITLLRRGISSAVRELASREQFRQANVDGTRSTVVGESAFRPMSHRWTVH